MVEKWKKIPGFGTKYEISNLGRTKAINYNNTGIARLFNYHKDDQGHLVVNLHKNGSSRRIQVYRIVANAFVKNPKGLKTIRFKDGIKTNISAENLEWYDKREDVEKLHIVNIPTKYPQMKQYPGYNHQTQYDMMKEASHYQEIYGYCKDAVVLDIGANIGSFAYQALKAGADKVFCIEASNRNYEFLCGQPFVERFSERLDIMHMAVVPDKFTKDKALFYEGSGKDTSIDSTVYRRGRGSGYYVDVVKLSDAIEYAWPTVLKIDIEGGEREFDWNSIPDNVKAIAIELHVDNRQHEIWADKTRDLLLKRWPILLREYDTYRYKKYVTKELVIAKKPLNEQLRIL